jgi:hypothetical protein
MSHAAVVFEKYCREPFVIAYKFTSDLWVGDALISVWLVTEEEEH